MVNVKVLAVLTIVLVATVLVSGCCCCTDDYYDTYDYSGSKEADGGHVQTEFIPVEENIIGTSST